MEPISAAGSAEQRQGCPGDDEHQPSKQKARTGCVRPAKGRRLPGGGGKDKQANVWRKGISNSSANDKAFNLYCGGFISFNPSLTGAFHSFVGQFPWHWLIKYTFLKRNTREYI